ncbi:MAG: DUF222 domain-containing protein [Acidimicrobiales bacterium]
MTDDFVEARDAEFDSLVQESAKLLAQAEARHASILAESRRRKCFRRSGFRSPATWVANLTGVSKAQAGSRVKRATFLTDVIPRSSTLFLRGRFLANTSPRSAP